jgi:glycogen(starch) synthase
MRILMLGWEFPPRIAGGLGTACFGLVRALDRLGQRVTFITPDPRGDAVPRRRAGFHGAEFIAVRAGFDQPYAGAPRSPGHYGHDLMAEAQRYAALVAAAAPDDVDVIHAHDWLTFPAGLALASLTGKPLVAHIHSTEADRSGGAEAGAWARGAADVEALAVRAADRVIAVSRTTAAACVERYSADPSRIEVIHNGIDGRFHTPASQRRSGADRTVLFLARLTAQKGPALFLLAARRALDLAPASLELKVVMAGDGDQREDALRLAQDLGLAGRVDFPGFLRGSAVARAYAAADLFVLTSIAEPFGLTALEAVRHGVPVILPPWAGVAEVLPSAPICRPDDAEALAGLMLEVLSRPDLARAIVGSTQAEARALTWRRAAESCIRTYEAAVGASKAAATMGVVAAARTPGLVPG